MKFGQAMDLTNKPSGGRFCVVVGMGMGGRPFHGQPDRTI